MVLAVSDSGVLIHLAKLNKLEILNDQFSKIYISEMIYSETVIQGLIIQKEDAKILQKFLQTKLISIEKVNQELLINIMNKYHIHQGESSVIVFGKKV